MHTLVDLELLTHKNLFKTYWTATLVYKSERSLFEIENSFSKKKYIKMQSRF